MNPDEHLFRAKAHLSEGSPVSLLYAALEFRLCVELRLLEYSEFASQFRKNQTGIWKAKDLASHVDGTYAMRPSVYTVEIFGEGLPTPVTVRYIPVSKETVRLVGQCDNFLHASGVRQLRDPDHQQRLKNALSRGIINMEHALSGAMSGPLIRSADGCVRIVIDSDKHPELSSVVKAGMPVTIRIEIADLITEEERLKLKEE